MTKKTDTLESSGWYLDNMKKLDSMYANPNCKISGKSLFNQIKANKKLYLKALKKEKKELNITL